MRGPMNFGKGARLLSWCAPKSIRCCEICAIFLMKLSAFPLNARDRVRRIIQPIFKAELRKGEKMEPK